MIAWKTAGSRTNATQAAAGDANGGFNSGFTDITGPVIILGGEDAVTNHIDVSAATNTLVCHYRVGLMP